MRVGRARVHPVKPGGGRRRGGGALSWGRNRLPELEAQKTDATNSLSVPSSKTTQKHPFSLEMLAIFIANLVLRQYVA